MSLSIKIKGTILSNGPIEVDLDIEIPERGFAVLVSAITSAGRGGTSYQKSVGDVLRELNG